MTFVSSVHENSWTKTLDAPVPELPLIAVTPFAAWLGKLSPLMSARDRVCAIAVFPLLPAAGIRSKLPCAVASVFAFLSDVSFAVYAIHSPMIGFVCKLTTVMGLARWPTVVPFLRIVLVLGHFVSRFHDVPVRGVIARWRKRMAA
ncbi:hypothetical protein [Porphyrobacter sp. YT40]|uniref:hypothetical protein n=1 Tax=Porphyrobacter sp. YT40 TaxID=2547601 RepID=UPI0015E8E1AB|nr:hypothetical protein [Porphyrobacter sp. YT40]